MTVGAAVAIVVGLSLIGTAMAFAEAFVALIRAVDGAAVGTVMDLTGLSWLRQKQRWSDSTGRSQSQETDRLRVLWFLDKSQCGVCLCFEKGAIIGAKEGALVTKTKLEVGATVLGPL